ncbi:MAG TPA: aminodeoxychorismate synthase component I [Longimicrobiales bacterium]
MPRYPCPNPSRRPAPHAILDFREPGVPAGGLAFTEPVEVIAAERLDEVRPAIEAVERAAARGLHAVGFIAYEAAAAFDPALVTHSRGALPLAWFGVFRRPIPAGRAADAREDSPGEGRPAAAPVRGGEPVRGGVPVREGIREREVVPVPAVVPVPGAAPIAAASPAACADAPFRLSAWSPNITRARYDADIATIREAIGRGETYQVNHTLRLRARFEGDATAFWRRLRAAQGDGFGAYLDTGRHRILSASPELFFRRDGERVVARPMKGTARRGRWLEEDAAAARALAASEKDRAENLMIVDLLRNDLGRVARFGSVRVPRLFDIERYPTVFQMTSTVEADVSRDVPLATLLGALFPCGSVTGAPKVATMRLIAALEDEPRGVYCGAIGWVRPGGDCVFSVAIRTVHLDAATGVAEYGVGGGITWDSTPDGEYDEALAKAAVLTRATPAFELIETLRLERGRYVRLDRHLDRLAASAKYFGWPDLRDAVRAALERHAEERGGLAEGGGHGGSAGPAYRVRVVVDSTAGVRIESEPFPVAPSAAREGPDVVVGGSADPLRRPAVATARCAGEAATAPVAGAPWPDPAPVTVASRPVSRRDPFRYHKTTHRAAIDALRAERTDVFDVLLYNEDGELTEFTRGNLVVALDGRLWTPPRECGLLAGAFRAELLERGRIQERVLRPADLDRADAVWFINSLREWVAVRVVDRGPAGV